MYAASANGRFFLHRWLPLDPLSHCLANTGCKLVILDPERAERLQPIALRILQKTTTEAFLVFDMSEPRRQWKHMESFEETLESYEDDGMSMLKAKAKFTINPEDNATIIFTSGEWTRAYCTTEINHALRNNGPPQRCTEHSATVPLEFSKRMLYFILARSLLITQFFRSSSPASEQLFGEVKNYQVFKE